jgi:predicted secreted hydrolase
VDITTLQSAQQNVVLTEKQVVDIFIGHFVATGKLRVYFAYRLADGTVVFNGQKTVDVSIQ